MASESVTKKNGSPDCSGLPQALTRRTAPYLASPRLDMPEHAVTRRDSTCRLQDGEPSVFWSPVTKTDDSTSFFGKLQNICLIQKGVFKLNPHKQRPAFEYRPSSHDAILLYANWYATAKLLIAPNLFGIAWAIVLKLCVLKHIKPSFSVNSTPNFLSAFYQNGLNVFGWNYRPICTHVKRTEKFNLCHLLMVGVCLRAFGRNSLHLLRPLRQWIGQLTAVHNQRCNSTPLHLQFSRSHLLAFLELQLQGARQKNTGDCVSPLLLLHGILGKALSSLPFARKTNCDSACGELATHLQSSTFGTDDCQYQAALISSPSMPLRQCIPRMSSLYACKSRPQVAPNNIGQKPKEFDLGAVSELLFGAGAIVARNA